MHDENKGTLLAILSTLDVMHDKHDLRKSSVPNQGHQVPLLHFTISHPQQIWRHFDQILTLNCWPQVLAIEFIQNIDRKKITYFRRFELSPGSIQRLESIQRIATALSFSSTTIFAGKLIRSKK